jgi:hypothetical protein
MKDVDEIMQSRTHQAHFSYCIDLQPTDTLSLLLPFRLIFVKIVYLNTYFWGVGMGVGI